MLHMVAPPQLTVIAARRSKQIPTKDTETKQGRRTNAGFAGKRKEELWQCVEGCGACCKLAKGPSFASPEEIFQNPSDIEVRHFISTQKLGFQMEFSLKHLFLLQHCDFQYQSIWSNLMNFSFIKAWLAQMDGAFTTRRVHVNAPFTPVRFSLGHSFQFWIRTLFQTWGLILH